jgi:hypothetical protein
MWQYTIQEFLCDHELPRAIYQRNSLNFTSLGEKLIENTKEMHIPVINDKIQEHKLMWAEPEQCNAQRQHHNPKVDEEW